MSAAIHISEMMASFMHKILYLRAFLVDEENCMAVSWFYKRKRLFFPLVNVSIDGNMPLEYDEQRDVQFHISSRQHSLD